LIRTHWPWNESQCGLEQASSICGAVLALIIVLKWFQERLNQTVACMAKYRHLGAETDLFNFQCSCTNLGVLQTKELKYFDPKAKTA